MTQQIIIVFGVQIRDYSWKKTEPVVTSNCDLKAGTTDTYTFPKQATGSNIRYEISIKYQLSDFADALNATDAIVMYNGHSRYGQGPSCGEAKTPELPDDKQLYPVNPWSVHYRMGYDAIAAHCLEDMMGHSILPTEYDLPGASSSAFLNADLSKAAENARNVPPGAGCFTSGAWRQFDTCQRGRATETTKRGDTPLKGRHYYSVLHKPKDEFMSAVTVGAADLAKSTLACKLLIMGSCSSRVYFFDALDRQRKATKSACKFILNGYVASSYFSQIMLTEVLVNGLDPTTEDGMKQLVKKFNADDGSGFAGLY